MKIYLKKYNQLSYVKEKRKEYLRRPNTWIKKIIHEHLPEIMIHRKENKKRYYQKNRDIVFDLLGRKCVYCGCDDLRALEINHKNGEGYKDYKIQSNLKQQIALGHRKIDDLEMVCKPCNALHYMKLKGINGWDITWKITNAKTAEQK